MRNARATLVATLLVLWEGAVAAQSPALRVTVAPEPEGVAWWGRVTLEALADAMRGIPAERLGQGWCEVAELVEDAFPRDTVDGALGMKMHIAPGASPFTATGTFDGRPLELALGVQADCTGGGGSTFLLVLDAARAGPAMERVVQVQVLAPRRIFMYLAAHPDRGQVSIPDCFRCGHAGIWSWNAAESRFVRRDDLEPRVGD